jgi:hypothetical protein
MHGVGVDTHSAILHTVFTRGHTWHDVLFSELVFTSAEFRREIVRYELRDLT